MATCQSNRVVGYARVSTSDKTLRCSSEPLSVLVFLRFMKNKCPPVKSRPVLDQLLAGLKRGDTLVVYKVGSFG